MLLKLCQTKFFTPVFRYWLLPAMRGSVCPPPCVYCLRFLIWGPLLQRLCPEQESSMSTHRTLAGARERHAHTHTYVHTFKVMDFLKLLFFFLLNCAVFIYTLRYVTSWIDTRQAQSERANLTILFDKYVPYCLEQVRCNLRTITPIPENSMVQVRTHSTLILYLGHTVFNHCHIPLTSSQSYSASRWMPLLCSCILSKMC